MKLGKHFEIKWKRAPCWKLRHYFPQIFSSIHPKLIWGGIAFHWFNRAIEIHWDSREMGVL